MTERAIKGFGLLQVLAVITVLTVTFTSLLQVLTGMNKSITGRRAIASRNSVFDSLEGYATQPELLGLSLPVNPATSQYVICIKGTGGANGCTATAAGNPTSFILVDQNSQPAAGTDAAPVLYNTKGGKCAAIDNQVCIFEARSRFYAICPGGAANCAQATSMVTSIEYSLAASVQTIAGGSRPGRKITTKMYSLFVSDILGLPVGRVCPGGAAEYITGLDVHGNPICAAVPPSVSATNFSSCTSAQIQTGNNANGSPICAPLNIGVVANYCQFPWFLVNLQWDGTPLCRDFRAYQRCVAGGGAMYPFTSHDSGCENGMAFGSLNTMQQSNYFYAVGSTPYY